MTSRILSVDDDLIFLEMIKSTLDGYEVITAQTLEDAEARLDEQPFDLIILDVNLETGNGYTLCKKLRAQNKEVPVLFISGLTDLESRMQAYGVGANDYISKPYSAPEIQYKVERLIKEYRRVQDIADDAKHHISLINNTQKEAAFLKIVNRFVQNSSQCHDFETLTKILFFTLKELNTSGVVYIPRTQQFYASPEQEAGQLEKEIIEMGCHLPRIHSFGRDRGLFRWNEVILLVREVHALIDILAILMDAMESSILSIGLKHNLVAQIAKVNESNQQNQDNVKALIQEMTQALEENLISLGIVSSLDEEDEEQIHRIINHFYEKIRGNFDTQAALNHDMKTLVDTMLIPSSAVTEMLEQAEEGFSDDIELF
jgi:DNA-binding response OmpR family regulator